jgi:hypothetical protein
LNSQWLVYAPNIQEAVSWYENILGWQREPGMEEVLRGESGALLKVHFCSEGSKDRETVVLATQRLLELYKILRREKITVSKVVPHSAGLKFTFQDPYGNNILMWQDTVSTPVRGVCRL